MQDYRDGLFVLRFRDLSVEPGQTIVRHRRVIATHDQCWWGWWARRQESFSREVVSTLVFPRLIALYDTDQGLVYSVDCLEARAFVSEVLSPKPDWTPAYYNNRRLRAWFRFAEISDATQESLLGRTCLYTASPTVEVNWMVETLDDLRKCETTMWILSARED